MCLSAWPLLLLLLLEAGGTLCAWQYSCTLYPLIPRRCSGTHLGALAAATQYSIIGPWLC
jgi:hypothetical protein